MSKQLYVFLSEKDLDELVVFIKSLNVTIIDYSGLPVDFNIKNFLIKTNDSNIFYDINKKDVLDIIASDVIQFSPCFLKNSKKIDMSSVYKDFMKDGFIVINDTDKFFQLRAEFMKNPIYVDDPEYIPNSFEAGRFWYASSYYNSLGELIKKDKLDSVFIEIKKHIKKNYIISKDKGYYIGKDAYQLYLCGNFVPCCGKVVIEF